MTKISIEIPKGLEAILDDLRSHEGRAYLVGGAVIDSITGSEIKDWDVEVYGLNYQRLQELLSAHGDPNLVGKQFGIIKLRKENVEYDFNIPRKESRIGVGHKDFAIELVPDITPKEAAYRRDLTINSMFIDLDSLELSDYYNGRKDLDSGILRHTSPKFTEDPLRVLRIMQLLPRKGKTVAPETIELCRSMVDEYVHLDKERVFEEWEKLLMRPQKPSLGLQFLVDCSWIKHYPELEALMYTNQNPKHHPEGSVFAHDLMVIDNAAVLKGNIPEDWRLAYMFGCLLHDAGKPFTTDEELKAYGHDQAGIEPALNFMTRITNELDLLKKVPLIVANHMKPGHLTRENAGENGWKRLHNLVPLNVIAYVSKADGLGRAGRSLEDFHAPSTKALDFFEKYGSKPIPKILMGRDLIVRGHQQGELLGTMVKAAYEIQMDEGIIDKEALYQRVKYLGGKI
jgi:tRNA nucleotidyltransferase (CCA-adding enzyme)